MKMFFLSSCIQNGLICGLSLAGPIPPPISLFIICIYNFINILFCSPMYSIIIGKKYIKPTHDPNQRAYLQNLVTMTYRLYDLLMQDLTKFFPLLSSISFGKALLFDPFFCPRLSGGSIGGWPDMPGGPPIIIFVIGILLKLN